VDSVLVSPNRFFNFVSQSEQTVKFDFLPNRRKVIWLGNENFRIAVAEGGGHITSLSVRGSSPETNPYWQPPWPSIEPDDVTDDLIANEYGGAPEGRLLASILGHSLALDLYGAPSEDEKNAGGVTHGMAGVLRWHWTTSDPATLTGECCDNFAQLRFSRRLSVQDYCVTVEEKVENLCNWDRPLGWQQHVSFGAPFCEDGFWAQSNCDLGSTHPQSFGPGAGLIPNTETRWPHSPQRDGGTCDYRRPLEPEARANDFTGYRVSPSDELGYVVAGNMNFGFAVFYLWPRHFFPWMGVWDERHARNCKPWSGRASVRAYEFGVSPFPQTRSEMLRRGVLFDIPTFLILPGKGSHWVRYVLGVFPSITDAADLRVFADKAILLKDGREIGYTELHEECGSSARLEMGTDFLKRRDSALQT